MTSPGGGQPRRFPVFIPVALVVVALGLAATAFFGGFHEVPEPSPEPLAKKGVVDQGQVSTEFEDAIVRNGGQDGVGIADKRYLDLFLTVTNQTDKTISAYSVIDKGFVTVRADGKTIKSPKDGALDGPRIVTLTKGEPGDQLHPGVPTRGLVSFELAEGQRPPDRVEIDAADFEWFESFIDESHYWTVRTKEIPVTPEDKKKGRTSSWKPVIIAKVSMSVQVEGA
jgi:hypothetical protein